MNKPKERYLNQNRSEIPTGNSTQGAPPLGNSEEQTVPINGFQQVLDMLKVADPAFRESLLKRLSIRDRELANTLRRKLAEFDI